MFESILPRYRFSFESFCQEPSKAQLLTARIRLVGKGFHRTVTAVEALRDQIRRIFRNSAKLRRIRLQVERWPRATWNENPKAPEKARRIRKGGPGERGDGPGHGSAAWSSRPTYVFSNFLSNFWLIQNMFWQTLRGSFSAVSKPNFVSKYSFESFWRDRQDLHAFAPLSIQNFSQNSSSFFAFSQFYFQNFTDFVFQNVI